VLPQSRALKLRDYGPCREQLSSVPPARIACVVAGLHRASISPPWPDTVLVRFVIRSRNHPDLWPLIAVIRTSNAWRGVLLHVDALTLPRSSGQRN
jgi:hypothetical protein